MNLLKMQDAVYRQIPTMVSWHLASAVIKGKRPLGGSNSYIRPDRPYCWAQGSLHVYGVDYFATVPVLSTRVGI